MASLLWFNPNHFSLSRTLQCAAIQSESTPASSRAAASSGCELFAARRACLLQTPSVCITFSEKWKGRRRGWSWPEHLRVTGLCCCWSLHLTVWIKVCLHRHSWINGSDAHDMWHPWLTDGWRSCWSTDSLFSDCCQSVNSSTRGCHNINVNTEYVSRMHFLTACTKSVFPPLSPVHQLGMEKRGNQNVRAITSVPWWRGSRCSEWIEWKGMVAVYFSVPVAPLWAAWVGCERRHQHDTHATLWKLNRCFWGRFHVIWSNTGHLSGTPSCCQLIHS